MHHKAGFLFARLFFLDFLGKCNRIRQWYTLRSKWWWCCYLRYSFLPLCDLLALFMIETWFASAVSSFIYTTSVHVIISLRTPEATTHSYGQPIALARRTQVGWALFGHSFRSSKFLYSIYVCTREHSLALCSSSTHTWTLHCACFAMATFIFPNVTWPPTLIPMANNVIWCTKNAIWTVRT